MAIRQKTVEYSFDTNTSALALTTRYEFAARTLTIAETANRIFKSVILEVTVRSQAATAQSQTAWLFGIKLGAAAFSDTTTTVTITNSGEHQGWKLISGNLADYFNTNFGAGTTQTSQAAVRFTALATINITAKLIITYEFDDAAETIRTKTVRIPLESPTSTLTSSLTEIGTNQVPTLSGGGSPFLPESGIEVKDLWFEFEANETSTSTVDFNLALSLDGEAEVQDGSHEQALTSSPWYKYIWRRPDMDITTTHAFKARTTVTSRMTLATVTLYVTYTYDHSASTRTVNSILIPFNMSGGALTTVGIHNTQQKFTVAEPGTISLKQSGIKINMTSSNNAGSAVLGVAVGPQLGFGRSYNITLGTLICGQFTLQHRIDEDGGSGGPAAGAGIILSNGVNNLDVNISSNLAHTVSDVTGLGIVNYHSDIDVLGADAHNHTTIWSCVAPPASYYGDITFISPNTAAPESPTISGSKYWINSLGHMYGCIGIPTTALVIVPLIMEIQKDPVAGFSSYATTHNSIMMPDTELCYTETYVNSSQFWKRHPEDPNPNREQYLDSVNRGHRFYTSLSTHLKFIETIVTYHTIPFTVSGTIFGWSGDGSGIRVDVRDPDFELVASGISTAGGYYAVTVYDDRDGYVADARQSSTRTGRSDNSFPTKD